MRTLQFWPDAPQNLLMVGDRTLTAGETFEASDDDVEELLASPDIRLAEQIPTTTIGEQDDKTDDNDSATHSPGRAQRESTT